MPWSRSSWPIGWGSTTSGRSSTICCSGSFLPQALRLRWWRVRSRLSRHDAGEWEGPRMHWQVQEAKQRFSEIVRQAHDDGPQVVTRHGEEVAVVIDIEEYRRLTGSKPDFKDFLLSAPDLAALEIRRPGERARTVELGDERAG